MVESCMSHSDDPALWLHYADDDLHAARTDVAMHLRCFHAQQAAEKAIKAVLVSYEIDFPWVHDLSRLVGLLPDAAHPLALEDAVALTPYASAARYPRRSGTYTPDLVTEAIQLASAVVTWAANIIEPGSGT